MPAVLTSKNTLNVEPSLKAKARKAAQSRGISDSAIPVSDNAPPLDLSDTPILARIVRLFDKKVELPKDWNYRDEIADILYEKYLKIK